MTIVPIRISNLTNRRKNFLRLRFGREGRRRCLARCVFIIILLVTRNAKCASSAQVTKNGAKRQFYPRASSTVGLPSLCPDCEYGSGASSPRPHM